MANEVNTLNIGGTSYPIYSEGIKVDSSVSGISFLVANGTGNRKIGISNAITGHDEELTISSNSIELGYSATNISIGESATNVNLGKGKTATTNGTTTKYTTTEIGENNNNLYLGQFATNVYLGKGADIVHVGRDGEHVHFGYSAGIVNVGVDASNVNLGDQSAMVSLGSNASAVSLGYSAEEIFIGEWAENIYIGPNVQGDVNRNSILINDVGELYMTGTHVDIEDPSYESHISMEYDSGSGAMNLNLVSGTDGEINIGQTDQTVNINAYQMYYNGQVYINSPAGSLSSGPSSPVYIGNINTGLIQMAAKDYNFIVTPNTSTINGFNITHQNNSNVGIVCYSPAAGGQTLFMAPRAAYSSSATVNLGTTSKRFGTLYVTSGVATSSFTSSSDERLKDFGDNIEVDLDALATLRKSYYRWNETSGFENEKYRMIGMSAQEVQKLYPEVVDSDENGILAMSYDRLSVVALAAIDKLHNENKELKSENAELKDRLTRLENLVNEKLSAL